MRKQLYLDIQSRLQAIVDENGNPIFKHFDLWNRNVEFIDQDSPFEYPAVFVEFQPITWSTIMNRVQQAEITVILHVVSLWFSPTAAYVPDQSRALEYLDLTDKLFAAMQSNSIPMSNGWMRINSTINHNHEAIVDSMESYVTLIEDRSAVKAQTPVNNVSSVISQNGNV